MMRLHMLALNDCMLRAPTGIRGIADLRIRAAWTYKALLLLALAFVIAHADANFGEQEGSFIAFLTTVKHVLNE